MLSDKRIDAATGLLLWLVTGLVSLDSWGLHGVSPAVAWVTLALIAILTVSVRPGRLAFVGAALVLSVMLALFVPAWPGTFVKGLHSAAFIAAFYVALSTLRNVAQTSPAIARAGTYLALQPPGRRYAALTLGGIVFSLMLNYGAISLLGSLATASARSEPDEVIRRHRTRRMLLAIQRGFVASLPWSPLAFAMAITNALIPGARWADSVGPGIVSAAILAGTGWALDTIFKPRLAAPPPPRGPVEGSWRSLSPLLVLLLLIGGTVGVLHATTGVSVPGIVILVVPLVSLGWAALQSGDGPLGRRIGDYVVADLPRSRGEIMLLMMAGYIGTIGAPLLAPVIRASGLDPSGLPAWLILAAMVWVIPLFGQIGMNPILTVTLLAPLLPDPAAMGVAPAAVVTAIAAGWAIGGTSSPFTATVLLISSFGNVSALQVGLRWNGLYIFVSSVLLTLWVLAFAFVIG